MVLTVSLFAVGVVLLLLTRTSIWVITTLKRDPLVLGEDEPKGFFPGNWILWQTFKWVFLPFFIFYKWRNPNDLELVGENNLDLAIRLQEQGFWIVPYSNHQASPDVWMPEIILWLHKPYRWLAENFFWPIGLKFFNRHLYFSLAIRCAPRIPVVPETMIPKGRRPKEGPPLTREQLQRIREVNEAAKLAVEEGYKTTKRWMPIFPEGTRQTDGVMREPGESFLSLLPLDKPLVFLPMPICGTWAIWKPKTSIVKMRPFKPVRLGFGSPILNTDLMTRATEISAIYDISQQRAAVNILMYALAEKRIEMGEAHFCGEFQKTWSERFPLRTGAPKQVEKVS